MSDEAHEEAGQSRERAAAKTDRYPETAKPERGRKMAVFKTGEDEDDAWEEPKPKSAIKSKARVDPKAQAELKSGVAVDER
ncbi:hypothetical protein FRC11_008948 [Ceratobasidium sp. 423]|nr:hypothetical protein FRC11_008948 [Ceratobasidium sp. 423]